MLPRGLCATLRYLEGATIAIRCSDDDREKGLFVPDQAIETTLTFERFVVNVITAIIIEWGCLCCCGGILG